MDPRAQLDLVARSLSGKRFTDVLERAGLYPLHSQAIEILQVNITRKCNLTCKHCHVDAGPHRAEEMPSHVLARCLEVAGLPSVTTVDITGGAPEMHPKLQEFIERVSSTGKRILVRSNLAILLDQEYQSFIDWYARHRVELVTSLPDPDARRTDRQRGSKTFERIIEAIRRLNARGYGMQGSNLELNLVHNPAGAYLAGSQQALEAEYRRKLSSQYGVNFTRLFCLNNCPIGRFLEYLHSSDNLQEYLEALAAAFNPAAARNAMCRVTLSVGCDGTLYDCDFNQMLSLPVNHGAPATILKFDAAQLAQRRIVLDNHCFACTAGAGSSCQGATA